MTVEQLKAEVEDALSGGDDLVHLTCCRPDVALCGEDLTGGEESDDGDWCIRCEFIDEAELPCGAPFCRLRSAWRWWRSR